MARSPRRRLNCSQLCGRCCQLGGLRAVETVPPRNGPRLRAAQPSGAAMLMTQRFCIYPGCSALISADEERCTEHRNAVKGTPWQRGYRRDWKRYSTRFRRTYPLCGLGPRWPTPVFAGAPAGCLARGKLTGATRNRPLHVDHVTPVRRAQNEELFWDELNHQSLCIACHASKSSLER